MTEDVGSPRAKDNRGRGGSIPKRLRRMYASLSPYFPDPRCFNQRFREVTHAFTISTTPKEKQGVAGLVSANDTCRCVGAKGRLRRVNADNIYLEVVQTDEDIDEPVSDIIDGVGRHRQPPDQVRRKQQSFGPQVELGHACIRVENRPKPYRGGGDVHPTRSASTSVRLLLVPVMNNARSG